MSTWVIETSSYFSRKLTRYRKKHPNEAIACLNNLETYKQALDAGVKPRMIQAGFVHPEPKGMVAIDQSGAAGSPRQTRLYTYPCAETGVLHLITIGDKNSQSEDIKDGKRYVDIIRKELKEKSDE